MQPQTFHCHTFLHRNYRNYNDEAQITKKEKKKKKKNIYSLGVTFIQVEILIQFFITQIVYIQN